MRKKIIKRAPKNKKENLKILEIALLNKPFTKVKGLLFGIIHYIRKMEKEIPDICLSAVNKKSVSF